MSFRLTYLLCINAVTFLVYGYDKTAALNGWCRVSEAVLHILALIGGTPGAYAGQRVFRHKTRKESFQLIFWLIVVVQVIVVVIWSLSRLRS